MVVEINKNSSSFSNIGNKAKFLIQMKNKGFNVPKGIVLDGDIYDDVVDYNEIGKDISLLLNKLNSDNIKEISIELFNLFNNVRIPKNILDNVYSIVNSKKKYAVRSSGTKEDLENYSFAGQYETFLNVSVNDLEEKIIGCYKSMFSEVILSYLVNNNISLDELKMSVIIQEMVDSDYSGICFTINPISGNDKEMLFEVSKGLGENIVSGKTKPEQYYYNWYDKIFNYDKKNKILNKKLLKDFSEVFLSIQLYFGYPCDIEFAIKDKKLYILQARKITKIKYLGIKDMWSTADFKDGGVSATVCTPFMWSLYEYIWEYTLRKFLVDSKILKDNEIPKLGEMFYGRCYWNMSVVKKAMSKIVGYKEREFDSEYGVLITYDGDGEVTKLSFRSLLDILRIALKQSDFVKDRRDNNEKYKKGLLDLYYSYKEMYDDNNIENIESVWYKLTKEVYLKSESTYFWQIFLNTIHQSLYKDGLLKYVSESDYLSLLGSLDNISHMLPFYEMWELSRKIRKDHNIYDFWTTYDAKDILKRINNSGNYMLEVKRIIEKYGYHSDKELDITYPCYYEEMDVLVDTIKDMVLLDDEYSPFVDKKLGKEKYEKLLDDISKKVSKKKYKKISDKVFGMRKMLWWREEFRDISTRFYYILRVYTLLYSKYLVKTKILSKVEDIWFLKVSNLWDYIDGKLSKDELIEIINKNRVYYSSYRNYMSENEIGYVFSDSINKVNDNSIKGLGANNGIVTARAKVIKDFSEIDRLCEGDILVTKFTDTGWTSKFAILSGIVTEYGGILCHAAIVSREYGIPAIVCCSDCMKKIKDGDIITINGSTGEVIIKE